jgi:hypothetical protein
MMGAGCTLPCVPPLVDGKDTVMAHHIKPVHFISCGPTMVGAVTCGTNEQRACAAIFAAAKEDGQNPVDLIDCNFKHQSRAIELLGFELRTPEGAKVDARTLPQRFDIPPGAPTIVEFVRNNQRSEVLACLAGGIPPGGTKPEAHSFAVAGPFYFDNNVGDEIVTVDDVLARVRNYRIALCFIVDKAQAQEKASGA